MLMDLNTVMELLLKEQGGGECIYLFSLKIWFLFIIFPRTIMCHSKPGYRSKANFFSGPQLSYQVKLCRTEFYLLEGSLNYLSPVQILNYRCKSSWFLNFESVQWFKFELAVDSKQFSSTSLHLVPIGPDLRNNEIWLNRIDVVQPILLVWTSPQDKWFKYVCTVQLCFIKSGSMN